MTSKPDELVAQRGKALSLHGEVAAKRQATGELLFFCSVGDVLRCKQIVNTWGLDLKDKTCCDYDKRFPLHLAAAEGAYSVVQWLLEMGCDVNCRDRFNRTPLEDAVRGDHGEVTKLLCQNEARIWDSQNSVFVDLSHSAIGRFVRMYDGPDEGLEGSLQPEWEIDPADIKLLEKVGEGEFGLVYRATWLETIVAVKVLRKSDAVALGDFRTELNVLQKVHFPYMVQFLGACTQKEPFMLVAEFLPGGSLADMFKRVNQNKAKFPSMHRAIEMALDCAKGMLYLHKRSRNVIIHRDLKPANLMFGGIPFDTGNVDIAMELGVIKIADFGLSKTLTLNPDVAKTGATQRRLTEDLTKNDDIDLESYKMTGETGSYRYMAPEVFRHDPYNSKVDVYAFSMIAYELFEGWPPFYQLHPIEAARRASSSQHQRPLWGKTNRFGKVVPPDLRALVEECWAPHADKRPSFKQVVARLQAAFALVPEDEAALKRRKGKCTIM